MPFMMTVVVIAVIAGGCHNKNSKENPITGDDKRDSIIKGDSALTDSGDNELYEYVDYLFPIIDCDGKWGCIDRNGNIMVTPQYDYVFCHAEGLLAVYNGLWGVVDKTGRMLTAPKYDALLGEEHYEGLGKYLSSVFNQDMFAVRKDGKWGYVDKTGREVISPKYHVAGPSFNKLTWVIDDNLKFIDKTGRTIANSNDYNECSTFSEGMAQVEKGKEGFIDTTGRVVIALQYDWVKDFHEGLAWFKKDGKWGVIDKTGREVISPKYSDAKDFREGMARVDKDGKWVFIDKRGKEVFTPQIDNSFYISDFHEGLAAVKKDGKWGYIDKTGTEVMPLQYNQLGDFHNGLAKVSSSNKGGFIDKTGQLVIAAQYDWASDFHEGLALVEKDGRFRYIDRSGKDVFIFGYVGTRDGHDKNINKLLELAVYW